MFFGINLLQFSGIEKKFIITNFNDRTICACIVAEIMMVCPKGEAKGLVMNNNDVNFKRFMLATCVAGFQLITAFVAAKMQKMTRKLPLIKSTICNVLVYLFFSLGLLYVIVKVRLEVMMP